MTGQPNLIMASRDFTRAYFEGAAAFAEDMRLDVAYDLFGPNRLDRRKRKRLLRRARLRGRAEFFERYGK